MTLPLAAPSAVGVDAAGLIRLIDAMDVADSGYQTLMIARQGRLIASAEWAPYRRDDLHLVYSCSKSITATVVGQLVDDGLVDLDAPVWSYLRADWRDLAQPWPRVLIRHCLSMTVGHLVDGWGPDLWRTAYADVRTDGIDPFVAAVLARVPDGEPGEVWAYNQIATFLLAQVVAEVTGRRVSAVAEERLVGPFGEAGITSQRTPQGRDLGFSGLAVTTGTLLGLGQTYLDAGVFAGQRVVSQEWAALAPRPVPASLNVAGMDPDWSFGYGFSFWGQSRGFRGDGAFGQFCVVLPELGVVVAITSSHDPMQDTLDLLWEHLVPACAAAGTSEADRRLALRCAALSIPPITGEAGAERQEFALSGDVYGCGETLVLEPSTDGVISLRAGDVHAEVVPGRWHRSRLQVTGADLALAGSGGWTGSEFRAELRLVETPHTIRIAANRDSGEATMTWREVPLTGPDPARLVGHPPDQPGSHPS